MNNDCLSNITKFLEPILALRISVDSVSKNFPRKIKLRSYEEVEQFQRFCQMFDISNLNEVCCVICDLRWDAPEMVIGWVPSSVKILSLDIYNLCEFEIPETVEELYLNRCPNDNIRLPESTKKITLGKMFQGNILDWSPRLEELFIRGWDSDDSEPHILDNLPETIHTMFVTWGIPVMVGKWPVSLKQLTIETCEDDMFVNWMGIVHAPVISNDVNYIQVTVPSH